MNNDKLRMILDNHRKWLNNKGGERADLNGVDLRGADLLGADLRRADLHEAILRDVDLRGADLCGSDLRGADLHGADLRGVALRGADLRGANLCEADLREADLDYSAFPMCCGGTRFKADNRLVAQILAHLCSLDVSDEARSELDKILEFAKKSHRAKECGIL